MNTAIDRVQNNVRAAIEKFIDYVEESQMKLTTKNTERFNRFNGHISMKTPAKMLAGLAMGVMLTWAGVSSYSALADEPKSPVTTAQQQTEVQPRFVQPRNTFTAEELLVIQAEMEDGYVQPRNTFTAEELLVIQAEMEDAYIQPRNTFTAEELLVIQAEIDDGYVQPRNTFTAEELLVIQAEIDDGYVQPRNTFTAEELLVIQAEMEDGFDGVVSHPAKQVEMSHAGGDRSVLQALQSHDVGSVFSAEEWLQIIAEIEDTV